MSIQPRPRRPLAGAHQRGQAMLLTVLLLATGITAIIYNFVTPAKQSIERDRITAAALAQAKAALIGYAIGIRLDETCPPTCPQPSPRIGDLPCPDLVNDGTAGTSCSNAGGTTIGRLPWKTLGLPDLRDGSGERLWYAVSANFKNNPAVGVLNSDSRGTITVRDRSGNVVNDGTDVDPSYTRSGAIAVIIAPGAVLQRLDAGGAPQDRSAVGLNNPVNYLDVANVGGNEDNANFLDSNANGFINGDVFDGSGNIIVNDRVITITYQDLMPLMERRVAKEVLNCLTAYASSNSGRYPWAVDVTSGSYSDKKDNRFGRIPDGWIIPDTPLKATRYGTHAGDPIMILNAIDTACLASPNLCMAKSWPLSPTCNLSGTWWTNWKEQVFYGFGVGFGPSQISFTFTPLPPSATITSGAMTLAPACPHPDCLIVTTPSPVDKEVVVIVAGKALKNPPLLSPPAPGQQRSSALNKQDAANYLEDENIAAPADVYTKLPPSPTFNDTVLYK